MSEKPRTFSISKMRSTISIGKWRRFGVAVFDYFYYNSDVITPDEAEKFIEGLRGETAGAKKFLESRLAKMVKSKTDPSLCAAIAAIRDAVRQAKDLRLDQ